MIKPLRRRHLQIWALLAVLLPAAILAGWLVVPRPAINMLEQTETPVALPLLLGRNDKPERMVSLRAAADTSLLQLEWVEKLPLTTSSALVYAGPVLLGRVASQGIYRWSFRPAPGEGGPAPGEGGPGQGERGPERGERGLVIVVYDIIHHQVVEKINF